MQTNKQYINDWTAYWQSGFNTSCRSNVSDDFPKAIKDFWIERISPLLKDNDKIIDLCSGAGGIPKLLIGSLNSKHKKVLCFSTDYTTYSRDSITLNKSKIDYMSECNCEALPFNSNVFDCITSSYGFEYSNIGKTLKQINRVIKKSGIFAAVIHTENSAVVANSRQQIKQMDYLNIELNFFGSFKSVFLKKRLGKPFQKKAEIKFKRILEKIKLESLISNNPYIFNKVLESSEYIYKYSMTHSITSIISQINLQQRALIQNQNRMKNLLSIVNDDNIKTTLKYFKNNSYTTLYKKELINNNQCVGFGLIVKKDK